MLEKINAIVWSDATLVLLLLTGLYFTCKLRFFQLRGARTIARATIFSLFSGKHQPHTSATLSPLQTLSATLAATMGTGNIVGVATAITLGGAGAVFWMWVSAFLGMLLAYAENMLGTTYRIKQADGSWSGGPMAYLEHGLHCRPLALLYAGFCVLASLGMGNMAQVNSLSGAVCAVLPIPPLFCGIAAAILLGCILFGGIARIGKAAERLIPPLALCYLLGCILLLLLRREQLPAALSEIFRSAFGISAIGGGISGAALRQTINTGLRRGIFSNEAGLGSAALLHANAADTQPERQGMWGIFEVFADTIVCCTMTALVLLTAAPTAALDGAPLVMSAFSTVFGPAGSWFVTCAIVLFAFATLVGWSCCGTAAAHYLSPTYGATVYRLFFLAACLIGAACPLQAVWTLSDLFNGLMIFPNLAGLLLLRRQVKLPSPDFHSRA